MRRFTLPASLLLLAVIIAVVTAQGFPGPRTTSRDADGNEVYAAKVDESSDEDSQYRVKDFGVNRPTLVYNCHIVPALCKNVRQYLGQSVSTATLHYDGQQRRKNARRDETCGNDWIDTPRTDGLAGPVAGQRCPEKDQPQWRYRNKGQPHGPVPAELYHDKAGEASLNRLATKEVEVNMEDGTWKTTYTQLDAVLSCDEWPAASWIEGGKGAKTYCSPFGSRCRKSKTPPKAGMGPQSEQDWQSKGHKAIATWVEKLSPINAGINDRNLRDYTIFKFDFKLVDDSGSDYGVWVEVRSEKRYCYGVSGPGTNDENCLAQRDGDPVREQLDEEDEDMPDAALR